MPKFFTDNIMGDRVIISGEDAAHLIKALRIKLGEEITVCDLKGNDYICTVEQINKNDVAAKITCSKPCDAEPKSRITLFQAIPKSDKMDLITQKAVELGVCEIVPVFTQRCVSRPEPTVLVKKIDRWQKIAAEAAKQSGRGIIPQISEAVNINEALDRMSEFKRKILFYEQATVPLRGLLNEPAETAVFTGPEGGFDPSEIELAKSKDISICTLGPRILRCETAPLAALAIILANEEII